ncbi:alpha/beta hydrolase [Candidatus Microgenomates bacterium]|nr:alpha/beta hydrolase [Candidatus Microgenomates bacterium]
MFKEKFYRASGVKLRYFQSGQGKPVLFLHGAGGDSQTYQKNLELLSKKYLVIAPDLPCFGKSSVPKKIWDFLDYANFMNKFINSLELNNIALIGHSFGAGVALNLAVKNKKISKLILISPAGIPPNYSKLRLYYLAFVKKTFIGLFVLRKKIYFKALKYFLLNILRHFLQLPVILKTINKSIYKKYSGFEKINIPTLILWSKKDEVFPQKIAKFFHNRIKNSQLEWTESNHDWCLLEPQEFFDCVNRFMKT